MSPLSDDDSRTHSPTGPIGDTPTVSCSWCGEEWDLSYELDELQLGNQSVEQFAFDHRRHTGRFPDDVSPWAVSCRQCPDGEQFLSEASARRWARTHARHTRHEVSMGHADEDGVVIAPE